MEIRCFDIGTTPCKAHMPASGIVKHAVLAVHGFGGSKESPTYSALARALCPEGIAVYGFDFPAHGAHPAEGKDFTVEACADALLAVAQHMHEEHPARAGVFATSFGGFMALRCMAGLTDALGDFALVLKAPAVKMDETFEQVILEGQRDQFEAQGFVELDYARPLEVHKTYLDGLKAQGVCVPYGKPMLVIHGDADTVVPPADIDDFIAQNPLAKLVRIPGADHEFQGEGQLDALVQMAREYFCETLF